MTEIERITEIGQKAFNAIMEAVASLPEYQAHETFFTHKMEGEAHPDFRRTNIINILQEYKPKKGEI